MNDVDSVVIARNIVLLEIISSINPDNLGDIEYLWDVWYNIALTQRHYVRLQETLKKLLNGSSSSLWNFGDRRTKKQVTMTMKSWLDTEHLDVGTVKKKQREFLEFYTKQLLTSSESTSDVMYMPAQAFCHNTSMEASLDNLGAYLDEWNQVDKAGIARDFKSSNNNSSNSEEIVNPTMMRPGSSKWQVHYDINPIAAYLPFER